MKILGEFSLRGTEGAK